MYKILNWPTNSQTAKVMQVSPVRDITGNLHIRQTYPRLKFIKPKRRVYYDVLDKQEQLVYQLQLIRLVRNS